MSLFLHQTTTYCWCHRNRRRLYMSLFLHQTTTFPTKSISFACCICLYSYIKPQPGRKYSFKCYVVYVSIPTSNHNHRDGILIVGVVVYVSIPTSNHNSSGIYLHYFVLYMSLFLHQTTTCTSFTARGNELYMSLFLHQTTTCKDCTTKPHRCICLYSYIKPQLRA